MKREQPVISFVSTVRGLENIEECIPRPTKEFVPSWWKTIPKVDPEVGVATLRTCPAISDNFSQGYVIPMWADTIIKYDKKKSAWHVKSGSGRDGYTWEAHYNEQAINHMSMKVFNKIATFIFKPLCPWRIITKPGWSVYQNPLYYHFDNNFSVLPGVIDTDIYHQVNQQVLYFGDAEEVFIKRGQPFVQYIPFERKKINFDVRYQTEKDSHRFDTEHLNWHSLFSDPINGAYRKLQRNRDSLIQ
jgi:hypothetical protein